MKLTILGRWAPFAPAGGAGTGYLVEAGGANLLLDGGPGTLSRLQELLDPARLTAVFVSHLHEDHIADLHSLQYAIWVAQRAGRCTGPLPIYAPLEPAGPRQWLEPLIPGTVEVRPLPVDEGLQIGELSLRWHPTDHPRPCWAVRIDGPTGSLVYTGDTGTAIDLAPFAAGVDLLLTEATYTQATGAERATYGHQTGAEAGELAVRAGVGKLLLTHLRPGIDPAEVLAEARAFCPVAELVEERESYTAKA
ncbi:MAG: MBL fold metallo-hydrolase [Bacillota bacterium]